MTKTVPRTEPPTMAPPPRALGQALQERSDQVFDDNVLKWLIVAIVPSVMAGMEGCLWLGKSPRQPAEFVIVALVSSAVAVRRLMVLVPTLKSIHHGMKGGREARQFLKETETSHDQDR